MSCVNETKWFFNKLYSSLNETYYFFEHIQCINRINKKNNILWFHKSCLFCYSSVAAFIEYSKRRMKWRDHHRWWQILNLSDTNWNNNNTINIQHIAQRCLSAWPSCRLYFVTILILFIKRAPLAAF